MIDVLNFFDRVGYLAFEPGTQVVNTEMALDRFGSRVKYYYYACEQEITARSVGGKREWEHLVEFHKAYIKWLKKREAPTKPYNARQIYAFLRSEHARCHRISAR